MVSSLTNDLTDRHRMAPDGEGLGTLMPLSKLNALRSLQTNSQSRVIGRSNRLDVFQSLNNLSQFDDIFLSQNNKSFLFTDFNIAFDYGKAIANRFGFSLRTKTSSHNENHGVQYKYVACCREGKPMTATEATESSSSSKRPARESKRCGCPFICRLIGLELDRLPSEFLTLAGLQQGNDAIFNNFFSADTKDRLWYWESYDRCGPHNHPLDGNPSEVKLIMPSEDPDAFPQQQQRYGENTPRISEPGSTSNRLFSMKGPITATVTPMSPTEEHIYLDESKLEGGQNTAFRHLPNPKGVKISPNSFYVPSFYPHTGRLSQKFAEHWQNQLTLEFPTKIPTVEPFCLFASVVNQTLPPLTYITGYSYFNRAKSSIDN